MTNPQRFEGVFTAIVTPFKDGAVDTAAFTNLINRQLDGGVDGIVAVGTTGESVTLTVAETDHVISHTVKTVAGRVPVVAGAGSNNTAQAVENSRRIKELGVDGLLHVAPYYNKPGPEGLYRHFEACAKATDLPVIAYNVPGRTSSDISAKTWARIAKLPTVISLKDATGDVKRGVENVLASKGDAFVVSGDDFTLLAHIANGGKGVISVVSNIAPTLTSKLWQACKDGDFQTAQKINFELQPLIELLFAESNPTPTKAALEVLGLCSSDVRLPLVPCSPAIKEKLATWLANRKEL